MNTFSKTAPIPAQVHDPDHALASVAGKNSTVSLTDTDDYYPGQESYGQYLKFRQRNEAEERIEQSSAHEKNAASRYANEDAVGNYQYHRWNEDEDD